MSAKDIFERRARAINSLVCIGLDSDINRLPEQFKTSETPQFAFNQYIIEQTHVYASAYKPNLAFYLARGEAGMHDLKLTLDFLNQEYPEILTICDAKFGDIGSTTEAYASSIFDHFNFDAVTLQPYVGQNGLQPFLNYEDKGCIIVCRTSNPGSEEFQTLRIRKGKLLWKTVAEHVRDEWNTNNNCMLVVGATKADDIKEVREIVPEMTLLVPGVGAQGGEVEASVRAGLNHDGLGMIINAGRSIIFAENPADAARALRDTINLYI